MLEQRQMAVILASASPRRHELLLQAGIPIEVYPAHIPEQRAAGEKPVEYACRLAGEKARSVAAKFPCRYVLGADTIVVVAGQVLEKPVDAQDAARMLCLLSGRKHDVTTAVSLATPEGSIDTRFSSTEVA